MAVATTLGGPPRRSIPARHIAAVSIGNALGFYDFLTYIYFALYIGRAFFPSHDTFASLLSTYGVSLIGFIARPVGALVLGPMGDRIGRKAAMTASFVLLGIGVVGMALTPSYAQIGVAAPVLVIVFRAVQGFGLGGEVGPTTAFLIEAAPPERRGFYASLQYATQDVGVLAAGLIGTGLALALSDAQLSDWGWRIAILIGGAIVPFGLWMRRDLPETLHAADDAALAPDATLGSIAPKPGLRPYVPLIIFGLMMLASGTIGSYTASNMTPYAQTVLHLPASVAFGAMIVNGGFSVLFEPVSGWLSDRFGRKPVMLVPGVLQLLAIFPAFWFITRYHSPTALYVALGTITVLQALSTPPVVTTLTEQLPKHIRSGVVSTVYAFAIAIFGGTTPIVLTALIRRTHDPMVPAYYWTGALVVGLIAMALVKESAPVKVNRTA